MSEEEVQQIYEYLHENYRYEDGELISQITIGRTKIGKSIGSFFIGTGKPNLHTSLTVNKKKYRMPLSHAIYLYHLKVKPRYLLYIDGNIMNTKIENLELSSMKKLTQKRISTGYQIEKWKCGIRYRARIQINGKNVSLGSYLTKEEAHAAYLKAKEEYAKNA